MKSIPRKNSWISRIVRRLFIIALILFAAMLGGWFWLKTEINRPYAHNAVRKTITIEPGAGADEIIAKLYDDGIIAHEWPAKLWLRFVAQNLRLKAGDYVFKSPVTPLEVINRLARGDVATKEFTIPEGYNQFDISRVMAGLSGIKQPGPAKPPAKPEDYLRLFKNTTLIADIDPEASNLEGYLFPDTYEFTANSTREQLAEAMVKRFHAVYTTDMQKRAKEMGMTTRQVVTLASLIEKEAKVDSERELISQVFHKRLKMGTPLACDPTLIYAALIEGKYRGKIYQSDIDRNSRYNTYKYAGLPPGPIASPGRRSLQAALYPAQTDYLYFVVDATKNDGSHKFSASSAEHEKAVQVLRQAEKNSQ